MKIVFFGTPDYVVPVLETLHKAYNRGKERQLIAVVTQPPKPVGRDHRIEHSAVDYWAFKHKLPIATDIHETPIAQLGILAAYGQIIPREVINRFELGILNIHPSALPEFRGASPIQAAIISGKENNTVTVMKMDEKMDHGPIVSRFKERIRIDETTGTLRTRIFERSGDFLLDMIPNYINGKMKTQEQNHLDASFTKMIAKQDGYIPSSYLKAALEGKELTAEWNIRWISELSMRVNPINVDRFIRAMDPWPKAWTEVLTIPEKQKTKRITIHKAHIESERLLIDSIQLEGKKEMKWKDFLNGYPNIKFD